LCDEFDGFRPTSGFNRTSSSRLYALLVNLLLARGSGPVRILNKKSYFRRKAMQEVFLNLVRRLFSGFTGFGGLMPRLDLDCDGSDCGGSDCGGSDCGGSDCNASDCNASDCGDSSKGVEGASSSADASSELDSSGDSSGSSSDRRTRDAGLVGGAAAGAAIAHHRRKKGQRNANDATDEDLANIPNRERGGCNQCGRCNCADGDGGNNGGEPYGKRPVRIRLRKRQ